MDRPPTAGRTRRAGLALFGGCVLWATACGGPRGGAGIEGGASGGLAGTGRGRDTAAGPAAAASYLQDDYERIFPERIRVARYGAIRFSAGDPGDAAGEGDRSDPIDMAEAPTLVVVDRVAHRMRVVTQQDHYRLLVWLDASDLYTVITDGLTITPDGAAAAHAPVGANPPGIRARPGLPVAVDSERRGMVRVSHRDGCVSVTGWVPRSALARQFVPVEVTGLEGSSAVVAGSQVLDRPGGRPMARFLSDCEVTETGPEEGGFRPILYATEWIEVRGWVSGPPPAGNAAAGSGGWGYGVGHLGLLGARSRFRLPEGTCLYGRRAGATVGIVTDDADFPITGGGDGWWQIPVETAWGDLVVWVAEERERASDADRKAGRSTRRADPLRSEDDWTEAAGDDGDDESEDGSGTGQERTGTAGSERPQQNPRLRRCR